MTAADRYGLRIAASVALGGFLMGFDASVISGVVGSIESEFQLNKLQLGWSVASLTLAATFAMLISGPLSDRLGRKPVLMVAAVAFAISAILSATAQTFDSFVLARMLGGLGVGAALIIAPMYIAEIAPPARRGKLVALNQLNIVLGISAAFFSNYLIHQIFQGSADGIAEAGTSDNAWRWMLGVEAIPAVIYFLLLLNVPESPRWLAQRGQQQQALAILTLTCGSEGARTELQAEHSEHGQLSLKQGLAKLFSPAMSFVLTLGLVVAIVQQLTGINAIFFYAPIIFEQTGVTTDSALLQAVLVGLVNLVFTLLAIRLIDSLGRKALLKFGLAGIAFCMLLLAHQFSLATYQLNLQDIQSLAPDMPQQAALALSDKQFTSDVAFREGITQVFGENFYTQNESQLIRAAVSINSWIILVAILGFVACFAVSLGPVMWVLFSEIFPNSLRAIAISFVGLVNSAVSFGVQLLFPWEMQNIGSAMTFMIYGIVAILGLWFVISKLPETRQKTLAEIEKELAPKMS